MKRLALIANLTVNGVLALRVSRFFGDWNFALGMFLLEAMTPIGAALQDPSTICLPLVNGLFTVAQKLMKLFFDVKDAA